MKDFLNDTLVSIEVFMNHMIETNRSIRGSITANNINAKDLYHECICLLNRLIFLLIAKKSGLIINDRHKTFLLKIDDVLNKNILDEGRNLFTEFLEVINSLRSGTQNHFGFEGETMFDERLMRHISSAIIRNDILIPILNIANIIDKKEWFDLYENLLSYALVLDKKQMVFSLVEPIGSERKKTGSYYTPQELIDVVLDNALMPVLENKNALDIKICDPSCGIGYFLISAANRIVQVARKQNQTVEKSHILLNCIYGVDINPYTVEMCKMLLWLECEDATLPLNAFDNHIRVGNSLLGATPAIINKGIPSAAFSNLSGDDKRISQQLITQNSKEKWQIKLFDDTDESIHRNNFSNEEIDYIETRLLYDAWCSVFFIEKNKQNESFIITENALRQIKKNPFSLDGEIIRKIMDIAATMKFFHWSVAFPEVFSVPNDLQQAENKLVGWNGGFDVVLGNPPWGRIKIQEKKWFSEREPKIARALNKAVRQKMIEKLAESVPYLLQDFLDDKRKAEGESHFIRNSGRYPLCGRGDVNTYSIFAETSRHIINGYGRVGMIVPSGIATDDTTKYFFNDLMEKRSLVSFFHFDNRANLFPKVSNMITFALLTLTSRPNTKPIEFSFYNSSVVDLQDDWRRITLSADDIALLNPNTGTMATFRSQRDAEITKAIYRRVPVLIQEEPLLNQWGITFKHGLFNMTSDSHLFCTRDELEAQGYVLQGNHFVRGDERYLPLYEAKLMHQFTHRWATYEANGKTRNMTPDELRDPNTLPMPRYWVDAREVVERTKNWVYGWLLAARDICRTTDMITAIMCIFPKVASSGVNIGLVYGAEPRQTACFCANFNNFCFDYVVRQKVGGTHLSQNYLKQLPVIPPHTYTQDLLDFIVPRVLELTYTAWDLQPFAQDLGYDGPPFIWDEERRFLIRCELDALYFHLYQIKREDVDYIMETFTILKRKEMRKYGEFRSKHKILSLYDTMT